MVPLLCHPDTPPTAISDIRVNIMDMSRSSIVLEYCARPVPALELPTLATPKRADGLWKTTCFEMFIKPIGGTSYFEFNLSPSCEWAAYRFDDYRAGMKDLEMRNPPEIEVTPVGFFLFADIDLAFLEGRPAYLGLSAVIEEIDGTKSYWALRHPHRKPDFHHPDCFALRIPAVA